MNREQTIASERRLSRLNHLQLGGRRPIRAVLDTDTYNEIDDQFALAYALGSPDSISLEAVYAAPFWNWRSSGPGDGMERSFAEIRRILDLALPPVETEETRSRGGKLRSRPAVFRGADRFIRVEPGRVDPSVPPTPHHVKTIDEAEHFIPVESDAARDLIERAMSTGGEPLYVAAIAAITNVASAILMEPAIIDRIVVVWLGGHAPTWPDTREFNLVQDIAAARVVFDSGVPLVQVPCLGVASHLLTTEADIRANVAPLGAVGVYLHEIFVDHQRERLDLAKEIWDIATIAYLVNPEWVPSDIVHAPRVTGEATYSFDRSRHFMRCAYYLNRGEIFRDMRRALARLAESRQGRRT